MSLGVLSSGGSGRAIGAVGTDARFPWHAFSNDTLKLQKYTNAALQAAGYCPVPTSGVLDASTCRALDFLGIRVREFFGHEAEELYMAGHFSFSKPGTCRFDDPTDPPTTPVAGCFQPTGFEGFKKLAGSAGIERGGTTTKTDWILIGGAASCVLAAFLAFKYSGAKRRSRA